MKADILDLLNTVVADHGHRSHKGLRNGFRLFFQETFFPERQVDICTQEDYWKVPLGSKPVINEEN